MAFSSEVVAPAYQLFNILKVCQWDYVSTKNGKKMSQSAKICGQSALVLTCLVRMPMTLCLSLLACKDLFDHLVRKAKKQKDHEIKPHLMALSAFGGMLILWLDIHWISGWIIPIIKSQGRNLPK